jgi:hypothetical protein
MVAEIYCAVFSRRRLRLSSRTCGFRRCARRGQRLYRGLYVVLAKLFERAIAIATERGDLASQALLLSVRALGVMVGYYAGDAEALLARAREAGEAVGGTARVEVLIYTALSLMFSRRPRDCIAAFEASSAMCPDLLSLEGNACRCQPLVPGRVGHARRVLEAGQHPRAVELLHQLFALGDRLNNSR